MTYATSPMGADHTAGNTVTAQIDHTDPGAQLDLSRNAQTLSMIDDSMGLCLFIMPVIDPNLEKLGQLYEYVSSVKLSEEVLRNAATEALRVECEFNRNVGLSEAHDRLLEFMADEPLPVIDSVFDVPAEELKKVHISNRGVLK